MINVIGRVNQHGTKNAKGVSGRDGSKRAAGAPEKSKSADLCLFFCVFVILYDFDNF